MSARPTTPGRRIAASLAAACMAGAGLLAATGATPAQASVHHQAGPALRGFPTFMKGRVVNSVTGNPVANVSVTLRDPVTLDQLAAGTTNSDGVFRINDLDSDEYAVKFNGSRRGYETGYLGCGHGVVASFDDACTFAPGQLGKARLDHL